MIISIESTILILAIATTLLIGYFKFDWFKNELYKVNANVRREINQVNYFTENKNINTKIALSKDSFNEQNYEVNTDFMVYLRDKIKIKENDYLYKACLVILKSEMTTKDEKYDLPSFNLRDKNKIKEFKSNPNGSKFPITSFSFFENGTISEIKYPISTDEYHTQTLKELTEKVIPKLSRNRTEDNNNGLKIKTRTDRKKKTLIEEEKPKKYYSFKGSKFSKFVEREFEDDELTNITTKTDIYLQSNSEDGEEILVANDFYFNSISNIISYGYGPFTRPSKGECGFFDEEDEEESLDNTKNCVSFFDDLMDEINSETNQNTNDKNNNNLEVRRLGTYSSISADQTFNIGKYNVLGQTVTVKYHVAVSKGNQINEIIIDSN